LQDFTNYVRTLHMIWEIRQTGMGYPCGTRLEKPNKN